MLKKSFSKLNHFPIYYIYIYNNVKIIIIIIIMLKIKQSFHSFVTS